MMPPSVSFLKVAQQSDNSICHDTFDTANVHSIHTICTICTICITTTTTNNNNNNNNNDINNNDIYKLYDAPLRVLPEGRGGVAWRSSSSSSSSSSSVAVMLIMCIMDWQLEWNGIEVANGMEWNGMA